MRSSYLNLPAGARPTRLVARASFLLMLGSCLLLAAPPAKADHCSALDVGCVTEPVAGTVEEVVDEVTDAADPIVDTVTETVDEVVGTVEETVDPIVDTVEETVDEVVGTVEDIVEDTIDPIGGVEPVEPVAPTEGVPDRREGSGGTRAELDEPADVPAVRRTDAPVGLGSFDVTLTSAPQLEPTAGIGLRGFRDGTGSAFANVIQGLAFPAILALVVAIFLAVQNRIDRRDPKLALAPVGPDVLAFV